MSRNLKLATSAGTLALVLGVSSLVAQEQSPELPRMEEPGMMQDGDMMGMMGMMRQMSEMMEACNRMMQAHTSEDTPNMAPSQPEDQQ